MNIQIKATNLELTPAIRSYIEKRAASFEKNTQTEEARLEVEVGKMSEHHKSGDVYRAEMHLYLGKQRFYVTAETSDLYEIYKRHCTPAQFCLQAKLGW